MSDLLQRIERGEIICPKCNSDEVYYENPVSGSGKYTCQDCEFMGEINEFNYSIGVKDRDELMRLAKIGAKAEKLRPLEDWHEDDGDVLWWTLPICEPPYVGSPLDCDWVDGIYTHWTPIIEPKLPEDKI